MKKHDLQHHAIITQLQKIGLNATDATIYLAAIRLGASSISTIAQEAAIHRITAHDSVQRLLDKGLLLETHSGKRRLIFPQEINQLQHLVDIRKHEIQELQHNVNHTVSLLQGLQLQSDFLPRIRIGKGQQGINDSIADIKNHHPETLYIITDSGHFDELLTAKFMDTFMQTKTQIKIILPAGFEHFIFSAVAKGLDVQTATLPIDVDRSGGIACTGTMAILHSYEGVYITTTTIENQPIATMMYQMRQGMRERCGQ